MKETTRVIFVPRTILKNSPSSYSEMMRWGRSCRQLGFVTLNGSLAVSGWIYIWYIFGGYIFGSIL